MQRDCLDCLADVVIPARMAFQVTKVHQDRDSTSLGRLGRRVCRVVVVKLVDRVMLDSADCVVIRVCAEKTAACVQAVLRANAVTWVLMGEWDASVGGVSADGREHAV